MIAPRVHRTAPVHQRWRFFSRRNRYIPHRNHPPATMVVIRRGNYAHTHTRVYTRTMLSGPYRDLSSSRISVVYYIRVQTKVVFRSWPGGQLMTSTRPFLRYLWVILYRSYILYVPYVHVYVLQCATIISCPSVPYAAIPPISITIIIINNILLCTYLYDVCYTTRIYYITVITAVARCT